MLRPRSICILIGLICSPALAQSPWYETNSWADMLMQMNENNSFFSGYDRGNRWLNQSNRYYLRGSLDTTFRMQREADTLVHIQLYLPSADRFNTEWLVADNPEFVSPSDKMHSKKPVLKGIYKFKSLAYTFRENNSWISVNPILNLQVGPRGQWGHSFNQNTRGIELRGTVGNKVGFYSRVLENQWFAPAYVRSFGDSLGVVPGVGWWRTTDSTGFDFFSVKGYINCAVVKNHVNVAFGHDKFFIGNGFRSLILSDFAKEYLFLKLNTQIGPFHYQNIFGQLNNRIPSPGVLPGNSLLPKKFMAVHRASILIKKRVEIGATEMIVFDRDSLSDGGFEPEYLNPVIFYRAVESNLGSRDNALIAFDFKAYCLKKVILYGQMVVDEFRIKEVKAGNGWWANKFGWQVGAKTTLNIKGNLLFLQWENNIVKPFTYSHYRTSQSWTQYGQALAHPLGANFSEMVFRGMFQPAKWPRFRLLIVGMLAKKGEDSAYYSGINRGGNLHKSNDTRSSDYGNKLLQGNLTTIQNFQVNLSYMVKHNLYLELGIQTRSQTGWRASDGTWLNFGLRWNVENMNTLF